MHRIAIIAALEQGDDRLTENHFVRSTYLRPLSEEGLTPIIISPFTKPEHIAQIAQECQGFIWAGGPDIAPSRYGAVAHPKTRTAHPASDSAEFTLAKTALALNRPCLFICRGMQLLNCLMGGDLIQHIPDESSECHMPEGPWTYAHKTGTLVHQVEISPGSLAARVFGNLTFQVTSAHHQALGRIADGLTVTGRSPQGIAEVLELDSRVDQAFCLGVQWHPETVVTPESLRLFSAFAEAVRGAR